jgi:hypothetical protein
MKFVKTNTICLVQKRRRKKDVCFLRMQHSKKIAFCVVFCCPLIFVLSFLFLFSIKKDEVLLTVLTNVVRRIPIMAKCTRYNIM